jgi:hypothetical protein
MYVPSKIGLGFAVALRHPTVIRRSAIVSTVKKASVVAGVGISQDGPPRMQRSVERTLQASISG